MKLEKPAPKEKKEPLAVSRAEVQAVKLDLQGLVTEGMGLEEALKEAIQANLPITMSEPTSPAEVCAMYHSLEEVPNITPYLMYGPQTNNEARKATQALIKCHPEALAEFAEEELETALLMGGDMQAAVDDNEGSWKDNNKTRWTCSVDQPEMERRRKVMEMNRWI